MEHVASKLETFVLLVLFNFTRKLRSFFSLAWLPEPKYSWFIVSIPKNRKYVSTRNTYSNCFKWPFLRVIFQNIILWSNICHELIAYVSQTQRAKTNKRALNWPHITVKKTSIAFCANFYFRSPITFLFFTDQSCLHYFWLCYFWSDPDPRRQICPKISWTIPVGIPTIGPFWSIPVDFGSITDTSPMYCLFIVVSKD